MAVLLLLAYCVVNDSHLGCVFQVDAATHPASRVIDDHIVENVDAVPACGVSWGLLDIETIGEGHEDAAALAVACDITLDQVIEYLHIPCPGSERRRCQSRLAPDDDAAAFTALNGVKGAFIQEYLVARNEPIVAQAYMGNTGALARGEVTAKIVVSYLIIGRTIMDGNTSAACCGPYRTVHEDLVVVDLDVVIAIVCVVAGTRIDETWCSDPDAATIGAGVVHYPVVADLQVVGKTIDRNSTTACGRRHEETVNPCIVILHEETLVRNHRDASKFEMKIKILSRYQLSLARIDKGLNPLSENLEILRQRWSSIDNRGEGRRTLELDLLIHDEVSNIDTRANDDQISWQGGIDRRLDRLSGLHGPHALTGGQGSYGHGYPCHSLLVVITPDNLELPCGNTIRYGHTYGFIRPRNIRLWYRRCH